MIKLLCLPCFNYRETFSSQIYMEKILRSNELGKQAQY